MGKEIWGGSWDKSLHLEPPIPKFDVALLPLERWIPGDQLRHDGPFSCNKCNATFSSIGELVHHFRQKHLWVDEGLHEDEGQDEQDAADAEYWSRLCVCSVAG